MTGQQFAPQYYIRIFSRGLGEINPTNVMSIRTNMATTSQNGDFTIDFDYRDSGMGSLDYFFRIEPQDYVEIYLRREPGNIGRWTEVKEEDGYFTESGKMYWRRDVNGSGIWCNLEAANKVKYSKDAVEHDSDIEGLNLFGEIDTETGNKTLKSMNTEKITIAKLDFIKNLPLTPSERLYNPDLVMVGLVDNISNNFGVSEESTSNSITLKGRTLSKFLLNHSYNSELASFYASLGINHFSNSSKETDIKASITSQIGDAKFAELLINLWKTVINRYTTLVNISPAGAAIRIFEAYVASLLGNFKVNDVTWGKPVVGPEHFHQEYSLPFPKVETFEAYKKLAYGAEKRNIGLGIDTSLIEIENPLLDPDSNDSIVSLTQTTSNGNLEIVTDFTELVGTKGYTFIDDEKNMATLHFYDAPWTHIYTSYVDSNGSDDAILKNITKDPWTRISPYSGSNFSNLDNPGLGSGAFFGTAYSLFQRLTNSNLNEFFIDEKGFMVLRKQISAYDQTRFVKKTYEAGRSPAGRCFVDKKYCSYIGLEDEYNRLIIKDSNIINMNLQRDDQLLTTLCISRPTMMGNGASITWYDGFRSTMPVPVEYLSNLNSQIDKQNIALTQDTSGNYTKTTQAKATDVSRSAWLLNSQLPKNLQVNMSDYDNIAGIQEVVRKQVIDILWKNKFSSLFSPPILNANQIVNFWQRNGYRVNVIDDYHSHTPMFALLSASEVFSKFNNSMWSGSIAVFGDPKYRAGKVVEIPGIPAKFYAYSISHEFVWGEKFTTNIGVTAGRLIKNADVCGKNSVNMMQNFVEATEQTSKQVTYPTPEWKKSLNPPDLMP